ncbi:glycerophosphodiester phosphodiesterase [Aurantibacter crassamenti]|uniref:glycerophosphodiester phosphodiesterase n=1 Tax=Aurantibacter crassamenti TaxID=1837375 RepID=UPI0019397ED2|nr:glycerophosphodiester phosphodiesterase family protein [Aurantibacter crassamenti]MBM1104747.1 glycerophosphodiester phosphodiesterase [Aurantibacter crassamenti]
MAQKPLVIGHRGAMGHVTENTVASMQKAMDLGVDMIEIDIFKIKSGELIVFHDDKVNRLTNGKGAVESFTLDELKQLKLDGNYSIPTLQEVLDVIDNKVQLNIELKGEGTTDLLNQMLSENIKDKNWELKNIIISSFKWDELRAIRTLNSNIRIAVLVGDEIAEATAVAKELNAEAINPHFKALNQENVNEVHKAGFKLYPFTINEPEDIATMKQFGVDGIITNFPERAH